MGYFAVKDAFFFEDGEKLQQMLWDLETVCKKVEITINTARTKIMHNRAIDPFKTT